VICANVAYPTDCGLLAKAVGKLVRTARRVQAAGGAPCTVMSDRRRAAARRFRQIVSTLRSRGKLAREESSRVIARLTGELAGLAASTVAQAAVPDGRLATNEQIFVRRACEHSRISATLTLSSSYPGWLF
jgi:transposase, IS5 family